MSDSNNLTAYFSSGCCPLCSSAIKLDLSNGLALCELREVGMCNWVGRAVSPLRDIRIDTVDMEERDHE